MKDSLEPEKLYPQLSKAADAASAIAQKRFMFLGKLQLALLCVVAFASGLSFQHIETQRKVYWLICAVMFVTLGVSTALRLGKFDDRWFRCRAFAENLKSSIWHYIMSSEEEAVSRERFVTELSLLRDRLPDLEGEFSKYGSTGTLMTDAMRESQALSIEAKILLYRRLRVEDQITWYGNKSKFNKQREDIWFWTVFILEFAVLIFAVIQALELAVFNPVSGIAACGTALIAWSQIKRYSDLATSYAIAAKDLRLISEANQDLVTGTDVDAYVEQVEKAVSREHSMWLAKRSINC